MYLITLSTLVSIRLRTRRIRALMLVSASVKGVGIGLFGSAPRRHSGFVGGIGRRHCSKLLFRHIVGRFVMRTNSVGSGSTPVRRRLNSKSLSCAVPTRVICPGCFRGHNVFTTTHANSRRGPRHTSSTARFCVMANGFFARVRLSGVRGRRNVAFAPRRHRTCVLRKNAPRLSNGCAVFNRIMDNVGTISGVRFARAGTSSHPIGGVGVGSVGVIGGWAAGGKGGEGVDNSKRRAQGSGVRVVRQCASTPQRFRRTNGDQAVQQPTIPPHRRELCNAE